MSVSAETRNRRLFRKAGHNGRPPNGGKVLAAST